MKFKMNGKLDIQTAGIEFQKTQSDKSINIIYEFVKRVSNSQCIKLQCNDTEEIVHRSITKIIEKIEQFDSERGKFHQWVYSIVINEIKLLKRKEKIFSKDVGFDYGDDRDSNSFNNNLYNVQPKYEVEYFNEEELTLEDVIKAIEDFEPTETIGKTQDKRYGMVTYRNIFKDLYFEGMTNLEIVDKYCIPYNVIYTVKGRYRKRFIEYLRKRYTNKNIPEFVG